MGEHLKVTPDTVRKTGDAIIDTADLLHNNVGEHSGAQDGDADANQNFLSARAVAECETSWEQAMNSFGTKIAVSGDKVSLSANTYQRTEHANETGLRPR